jgi:ZIP family zinc transporter
MLAAAGWALVAASSLIIGAFVAQTFTVSPRRVGDDMRSHSSAARLYRMWIAIAVVSALAGGLGYVLGRWMPGADGRDVQAFAGGAVLTMLAGSMMPEAYEDGGRRVALFTALGFAIAAILTTLD